LAGQCATRGGAIGPWEGAHARGGQEGKQGDGLLGGGHGGRGGAAGAGSGARRKGGQP
jgi:hypothetical protein